MAISFLAHSLKCSRQDRVPLPLANMPSVGNTIFLSCLTQGGLSSAHWLSGSVTFWGLLTGDKYSLGKILPTVPLGLSCRVGQGAILLFSLLSIYPTVRIALMRTHFPDEFGAVPKRLALLVCWFRGLHQSTRVLSLAPWARP